MDYKDPGWRRVLKHMALGFIPGYLVFTRRGRSPRELTHLEGIRLIFLSLVVSLCLFLVILTSIAPHGWELRGPAWVNLGLATIGLLSLAAGAAVNRKRLSGESEARLLGTWLRGFFIQIGMAEAAALLGFVGTFLTGSPWTYVIGLAFAMLGFIVLAPTWRNIARRQEQLIEQGSPLSLGTVLAARRRHDPNSGPPLAQASRELRRRLLKRRNEDA